MFIFTYQVSVCQKIEFKPISSIKIFEQDSIEKRLFQFYNYTKNQYYSDKFQRDFFFYDNGAVQIEKKSTVKNTTMGGYQYLDSNTIVIKTHYEIDQENFLFNKIETINHDQPFPHFKFVNSSRYIEYEQIKISKITYSKWPKFLHKTRTIYYHNESLSKLVNKHIVIHKLWINSNTDVFPIEINSKLKIKNRLYIIHRQTNGIKIIKKKEKLMIYEWKQNKRKYKKTSYLAHRSN